MKTIKSKIDTEILKQTLRKKGVQSVSTVSCPHCAVPFVKLGQHINACMMNPERQALSGAKVCPKCEIASTGKNFTRHAAHCNGDKDATINKALQSFRSEYLRIVNGGQPRDGIDRSLGYGHRAVPEIFRMNVERDLLDRGMPKDWSIDASLRLVKPKVITPEPVTETKNKHQVIDDDYAMAIGSVVNLITDERTFAEVLNHVINLATYKLATR